MLKPFQGFWDRRVDRTRRGDLLTPGFELSTPSGCGETVNAAHRRSSLEFLMTAKRTLPLKIARARTVRELARRLEAMEGVRTSTSSVQGTSTSSTRLSSTLRLDSTELVEVRPEGSSSKSVQGTSAGVAGPEALRGPDCAHTRGHGGSRLRPQPPSVLSVHHVYLATIRVVTIVAAPPGR